MPGELDFADGPGAESPGDSAAWAGPVGLAYVPAIAITVARRAELDSEALAARIAEREARKSRAEINIERNKNQDDDESGEDDLAFGRHGAWRN